MKKDEKIVLEDSRLLYSLAISAILYEDCFFICLTHTNKIICGTKCFSI